MKQTWNCEEKSQNSEKIDLIFMPQWKQAFRLTLEEENCAGMFTYFFPSLNFDIKIASQILNNYNEAASNTLNIKHEILK